MKLRHFIYMICTLSFFSCVKEREYNIPDYPKNYYYDSFVKGDLTMYTNEGLITDITIINNYLTNFGSSLILKKTNFNAFSVFNYTNEPMNTKICDYAIRFLSETEAIITIKLDTLKAYSVTEKENFYYFEGANILLGLNLFVNNPRYIYSPRYTESLLSSTPASANDFLIKYRPCLYLVKENKEIHLPLIIYVESRQCSSGFCNIEEVKGETNNSVNSAYLDSLIARNKIDTLLFQECFAVFKQK